MKTYKVKVIKSREDCFWYSKHINEVFTVRKIDEDEEDDDYIILDNDYPKEGVYSNMASIENGDCEIVKPIVPEFIISKHKLNN